MGRSRMSWTSSAARDAETPPDRAVPATGATDATDAGGRVRRRLAVDRAKRARGREAAAKAVCAPCPVLRECLDWALHTQERWGVWGGTTPEERAELLFGNVG